MQGCDLSPLSHCSADVWPPTGVCQFQKESMGRISPSFPSPPGRPPGPLLTSSAFPDLGFPHPPPLQTPSVGLSATTGSSMRTGTNTALLVLAYSALSGVSGS